MSLTLLSNTVPDRPCFAWLPRGPRLFPWRGAVPLALVCLIALGGAGCAQPSSDTVETGAEGGDGTGAETGAETGATLSEAADAPSSAVESVSEGTRRMRERLEQVAERPSPSLLFRNERRLAQLRAHPEPSSPERARAYRIELATELLRTGQSIEAAELFAALLDELGATRAEDRGESAHTATGVVHGDDLETRLRSLLAISHLRRGEQENCLEHASAEACLLPISPAGQHRLPAGSEAALAELAILLERDPDDLASRWLYNIAAMTLGRYPDQVTAAWRIPQSAFESDVDLGRFVDIAPRIGLDAVGLAGGIAVDDFDGDGDLDVVASSWGERDPLRFFRNRAETGSLRFEDDSRRAGLDGLWGGLSLNHADYDNDGDLDVLVLRGAWLRGQGRQPNSLLRNDGTGRFDDVTEEAGLLSFHPTQAAAWGDFDNDGWLDLFVGNESSPGQPHPGELFRNNGPDARGRVTFTEMAFELGVVGGGMMKGAVWGDFDNDGYLDLFVSRLRTPNLLFRNRGPRGQGGLPTFEEIGAAAGVTEPLAAFPAVSADFDQDGWLDLFVGAFSASFDLAFSEPVIADLLGVATESSRPKLLLNNRDGTFRDATRAFGLDRSMLIMAANHGDLDHDGWPDLYLGTGAPDFRALVPNEMFRNDSGRRMQRVTTSGGFGHLQKGHGIAFADLDQDGDQDVLSVIGGAFSGDVYRNVAFANPGHGNRFVILRLEGTSANRAAIGARLTLHVDTPDGPRRVHAEVGTGGSFGSSSLQQEIGLGDATALRRVEVRWAGAEVESWENLPLDRRIFLRQNEARFRVEEPTPIPWPADGQRSPGQHRHGAHVSPGG